MKYGKTDPADEDTKEKAYELVYQFVERFKSRKGSILCRDLLGCDLSTEEGLDFAEENNLIATRCPKFVQDAAEILEELLELTD